MWTAQCMAIQQTQRRQSPTCLPTAVSQISQSYHITMWFRGSFEAFQVPAASEGLGNGQSFLSPPFLGMPVIQSFLLGWYSRTSLSLPFNMCAWSTAGLSRAPNRMACELMNAGHICLSAILSVATDVGWRVEDNWKHGPGFWSCSLSV